ncbi:MAG: hypothetical protein IKH77_06260 [Clostridia bacterium]|jgi:hypothetical protein|nr:hypothetical protein [Clostridia bacterium]
MIEPWIPAISALGTGLLSLFGVYLANRKNAHLVIYRLEQLEHKVDKHNGLVERMTAVEVKIKDMGEQISDLKKKVSA